MIFRPKIDFLKLPPNVTPGMPPASPRTPRARKRLFRALGRLKGRPGEACIMSKNLYKKSKIHEKSRFFVRKSIFCIFFVRARSERVPERFRRLRGPSRSRFRWDFAILFCRFRRDLFEDCRVPPGCCRDPHPTSVTHSPGFPWGTAIREAV